MHKKLEEVKDELKKRMHEPIQCTGKWLKAVATGHFRYYGVPGSYEAMNDFGHLIAQKWKQSLKRRSQKAAITWEKMTKPMDRWIHLPRICHKYPSERFGVTI